LPTLFIDFETRSTLDLKKVGAWRYACHPTTNVLCCCFTIDSGAIETWKPGDPVPQAIIDAAADPTSIFVAHNAGFERVIMLNIMRRRYDWPNIRADQYRCTQAMAQTMALPAALEAAAEALKLNCKKDVAGARLMLTMSRPRKPRPGEDATVPHWHDEPDRLRRLIEYCEQDVAAERALYQALPPLSPEEQDLWLFNARMNELGVPIDVPLLHATIAAEKKAKARIKKELTELTGLGIDQVDKVRAWLAANGCDVGNLQGDTLEKVLKVPDLPRATRRAIELRLEGAHTSKLTALQNRCDPDGRVRGEFMFHGARTGRFSSRGVQFQNLKKPTTEDLAGAIAAVMAGHDQPMSVLGDLARAIVAAPPGHKFIIVDLSGVESRIGAWLSSQEDKIEAWRTFDGTGALVDDPYYRIGKASGLSEELRRPIGKIQDLAFQYMGGVGAWRRFSLDDGRSDEDINKLKYAWRDAHPKIIELGRTLDRSAINAVKHPGALFSCGRHLSFRVEGDFLKLRLPSGRERAYPFPRIEHNDRGDEIVVFKEAKNKKFINYRGGEGGYSGTWLNNAVQGVARDIFTTGMLALDRAGYRIVAQIHDEVIVEAPDGFGDLEEVRRLMTETPAWAAGLPIAAKGRNGPRFAKIAEPAPSLPSAEKLAEEDDPIPPWAPGDDPRGVTSEADTVKAELSQDHHDHTDPEPEQSQAEQPKADDQQHTGSSRWQDFDFRQYTRDQGKEDGGGVIARYVYEDAAGRPYQRVNRTTTKRFFYEYWNGKDWVLGKPPSGPLPYRLPQLIATAPDEIVAVCEGERDANTAADLGFVATCNAGGAGKFTADHARWFTGKKHVIIPEDNDDAGRNHAAKTAAMLHGIVPDIRIASFPELPNRGDLTDWVFLGHTREELIARSQPAPAGSNVLNSVRASNITMRGLKWIWPDRFAIGKLGIIAGLPEEGKGQILCDIASRITRGAAWPCNEGVAPIGSVLLLTAEDDPADTVIPRLAAAGADLDRIEIIKSVADARQTKKERMFSLIADLGLLRQKALEMGDVLMVQIDPITAYLGIKQIDSFRTTDVRAVLSPLVDLASDLQLSILGVMHFNKRTDVTNALLRISDSLAYGATARHVYAAVADPANGNKLFVRGKNNLVHRDQKTLSYIFDTRTVGIDPETKAPIIAPYIVWTGHVDVTASEAMQAASENKSPSERDNAKEFLIDLLSNGSLPSAEIEEAAEADGISQRTLFRAKRELKIKSKKDGLRKDGEPTWRWHLPANATATTKTEPA
jgi:DNA polymerase